MDKCYVFQARRMVMQERLMRIFAPDLETAMIYADKDTNFLDWEDCDDEVVAPVSVSLAGIEPQPE